MNRVKELLEKLKGSPKGPQRIPKESEVFAVGTGTYVGEMWVFVEKAANDYHFLSVPKNINRFAPIDKFDWAIQYKITEFVEKLPGQVYEICKAQFMYNKKHGNHKKKPEKVTK